MCVLNKYMDLLSFKLQIVELKNEDYVVMIMGQSLGIRDKAL